MASTAAKNSLVQAGASPGVVATSTTVGSQQARNRANASFGAFIDLKLQAQVQLALGAHVDLNMVVMLTTALKKELRARVGGVLGISGGIAAGGVGGTAGGGANLQAGAGISAGFAGGISGSIGGVAVGATSLGAGLGTRAVLPGASGAPVSFGKSSTNSFGVGAQAGFSASAGPDGAGYEAHAKVTKVVTQSFRDSLVGAGFTQEEISSIMEEASWAISDSVEGPFKSAYGPDVGYPRANNVPMLGHEIVMQEKGAWTATVTLDLDDEDDENDGRTHVGPFVIDVDGVEFRGTVVPDRSGSFGGVRKVRVVGGAGGLDYELESRNYAGGFVTFKTIFSDILRDSGEAMSVECKTEVLNTRFQTWQRSRGRTKDCLDVLCARVGFTWRVLRDGTIWVGSDEWPEVEPTGTVMHEHHSAGVVKVAPDFATLVPGIIVRGQKIKQVVHRTNHKSTESLRTDCYARSTQELFGKLTERSNKKTEYAYRYRCVVDRQNPDGTVDVTTDDPRMKGRGIAKCVIRVGIPGTTVKVSQGARCLVGWVDGVPDLPYVDSWESGAPFVSINIG